MLFVARSYLFIPATLQKRSRSLHILGRGLDAPVECGSHFVSKHDDTVPNASSCSARSFALYAAIVFWSAHFCSRQTSSVEPEALIRDHVIDISKTR